MISRLLFVFLASGLASAWLNDYDKPMTFTCPNAHQAIHRIVSEHDNHHEDRRFDITCTDIASGVSGLAANCHWSGFVNSYDQAVQFSCPDSYYLSGMASNHDNHHEDRIWKFYCCQTKGYHEIDCQSTGPTNEFDQDQDYTVPQGKVIKGVNSEHNNHHEDRRYSYTVCGIRLIPGEVVG